MADLIRRTFGPSVSLEVAEAGGLWITLCDPNQLEKALLNLCINSRDAMPDGGRLTIETANASLDLATARQREAAGVLSRLAPFATRRGPESSDYAICMMPIAMQRYSLSAEEDVRTRSMGDRFASRRSSYGLTKAVVFLEGWAPPTWRTVKARVLEIDALTRARRRGDRVLFYATDPAPGEYVAGRPLGLVQIDHTEVDVIVVDEQSRKTHKAAVDRTDRRCGDPRGDGVSSGDGAAVAGVDWTLLACTRCMKRQLGSRNEGSKRHGL